MKLDMIAFETEMKHLRGAYIVDIAPACEMYRAALARVAELEAQLAAQQWRPVTEKPTADETYLLYRASPPQTEPWRYDFGVWEDDRWDNEGFTHWRPLPPAPQETE